MKIKITALLRYVSFSDPMVTYRQEIQWNEGESWSDLGCRADRLENFGLLCMVICAGAKRLKVAFIYEDWTERFGQQQSPDMRTLEDKIKESLKEFISA